VRARNQLDSFTPVDTIPVCDRHTGRRTDRHTTTANAALALRRAVKRQVVKISGASEMAGTAASLFDMVADR